MTKTTRNLLILFSSIFAIKATISFFMSGTYFYSDEACVVIKSKHFIETLRLMSCSQIAAAPGGDPHPLYSLIISPLFFFFKGFNAYIAVLIFNSLAISSLVFPLYWIAKNFIKKDSIIFLIITTTLFLPHVTIYEKTVLTESFFVFLNIWLLYFYGKYKTLKKGGTKYLILTILFAIFAGLERPFGFIVSMALIINEIITSKNRLRILVIFLPIFLLIIGATLLILGNVPLLIDRALLVFQSKHYFLMGLTALKNQINSLTVATLFIPVIIFAGNFKNKSSDFFNKTKYYILTLIVLNLLISANHIYGYLYEGKITDLITRYINISIIILIYFSLIFFFIKKKFILNSWNTAITLIAMVALVFFNSQTVKHSLNMDLSAFYLREGPNIGDLVSKNNLMELFFFPTIIFLFSMLVFNKRKILISIFIGILIFWGGYNYYWNINHSRVQNIELPEKMFFRNTEYKLINLQPESFRTANFIVWDIKTLTKNTIDFKYLDLFKRDYYNINFYKEALNKNLSKYDFILSNAPLRLPVRIKTTHTLKIYYAPRGNSYEEHIELLKSENKEFSEEIQKNKPTETPDNPTLNDKE